jgi:hypothetical protein
VLVKSSVNVNVEENVTEYENVLSNENVSSNEKVNGQTMVAGSEEHGPPCVNGHESENANCARDRVEFGKPEAGSGTRGVAHRCSAN